MSEIIILFISEIILQNKNSPLPKWRDLETGSRWASQSERRPCGKKESDWWRQGNIFKCGMRLIKLLKDPLEGDDYCSVAMINIFLSPSLLLLISGPAWSRIIRWWQHISFVKTVQLTEDSPPQNTEHMSHVRLCWNYWWWQMCHGWVVSETDHQTGKW